MDLTMVLGVCLAVVGAVGLVQSAYWLYMLSQGKSPPWLSHSRYPRPRQTRLALSVLAIGLFWLCIGLAIVLLPELRAILGRLLFHNA